MASSQFPFNGRRASPSRNASWASRLLSGRLFSFGRHLNSAPKLSIEQDLASHTLERLEEEHRSLRRDVDKLEQKSIAQDAKIARMMTLNGGYQTSTLPGVGGGLGRGYLPSFGGQHPMIVSSVDLVPASTQQYPGAWAVAEGGMIADPVPAHHSTYAENGISDQHFATAWAPRDSRPHRDRSASAFATSELVGWNISAAAADTGHASNQPEGPMRLGMQEPHRRRVSSSHTTPGSLPGPVQTPSAPMKAKRGTKRKRSAESMNTTNDRRHFNFDGVDETSPSASKHAKFAKITGKDTPLSARLSQAFLSPEFPRSLRTAGAVKSEDTPRSMCRESAANPGLGSERILFAEGSDHTAGRTTESAKPEPIRATVNGILPSIEEEYESYFH